MNDPDLDLTQAIFEHSLARSMAPWNAKEHDDLRPRGETVDAIIDHWLACRADIIPVGLGQTRYALSTQDVRHLAEHIEKWLALANLSGVREARPPQEETR
jgi:hypothetical protein